MKKIHNIKLNLRVNFLYTFAVLFFLLVGFAATDIYPSVQISTWGISREKVMKDYIQPSDKIVEFSPSKKPDYENKIMNLVNLILKNIEDDPNKNILIISTQTDPRKDFLLYKNKLFSIMEYYNLITKENLSNVIKALSKQYGESTYNPSTELDVYTISNKETKIIVHYYVKTMKCEVYYYDTQLYRKLSSNEF